MTTSTIGNNSNNNDEDEYEVTDAIHAQQDFKSMLQVVEAVSMRFAPSSKKEEQEEETKGEQQRQQRQRQQRLLIQSVRLETKQEVTTDIINEIDDIGEKYIAKGMNENKFTFGLFNCFLIFYVFGAFPGHFWLVYVIQSSYWMAEKFRLMWKAKPLCEILYYLDFCWMMNFLALMLFFVLVLAMQDIISIDHESRRQIFMAAYGIAAGPVFAASTCLSFIAFLFHDINTMANLVIHMLPSMLMYCTRWQTKEMQEAYPSLFNLQYIDDTTNILFYDDNYFDSYYGSVSKNAILVYLGWFVPYTIFFLLIGLKLPSSAGGRKPKYDTVFHATWRGGPCDLMGKTLWKRPSSVSAEQSKTNNFEVRDFAFYMAVHAFGSVFVGILIVARLCHYSQLTHGICLAINVFICCRRGAQRYTYYTTHMYSVLIRKQFGVEPKKED